MVPGSSGYALGLRRFRAPRLIGTGAFASVWQVHDDVLDHDVAVKVLAENWAWRSDVRARFVDEAAILGRIDSRHVVRVLDSGEFDDGRPFLVMELAAGTLEDRIGREPQDPATTADLMTQICAGVTALHEAGVLHRDLKPGNILFRPGEPAEAVVADLGLAKTLSRASGLTIVAGSPGYMSPEQSEPGASLDVRSDVYSLGALAYRLFTGTDPAPSGRVVPMAAVLPGIARPAADAVARAMRTDPRHRFAGSAEFAHALRAALSRPAAATWTARRIAAAAAVAVVVVVPLRADAPTPSGYTEVSDPAGQVVVPSPAGWSAQVRTSGWDPGRAGLPGGWAPAVEAAPDLAGRRDPDSAAPGLFAGRVPGADATPWLLTRRHDRCAHRETAPVDHPGLRGTVVRWSGYGPAGYRIDEAVVSRSDRSGQFFVQVKGGRPETADVVLAGLGRS
ncbi:protein kinase [Amycolatopsis sp. NBC_00355]|uniref:serine/threonine-protein kinase n=1 Tax=Amycolatopsis sp. NBC_00355 TaxID=2975957 RepID=UPI002E26343F